MAGYSGTPLQKKLGIKENFNIALVNEPEGFRAALGILPDGVKIRSKVEGGLDLILLFVDSSRELERTFPRLAACLVSNGMLWISWPKKSSGVLTDLNFDVVQKTGLSSGLVDTKICAVNDTWSGLKFVIRVKDRTAEKR